MSSKNHVPYGGHQGTAPLFRTARKNYIPEDVTKETPFPRMSSKNHVPYRRHQRTAPLFRTTRKNHTPKNVTKETHSRWYYQRTTFLTDVIKELHHSLGRHERTTFQRMSPTNHVNNGCHQRTTLITDVTKELLHFRMTQKEPCTLSSISPKKHFSRGCYQRTTFLTDVTNEPR